MAKRYKFYSPTAIALATLFGTPIAGSVILARNYRHLGLYLSAWIIIGFGVLATLVLFSLSLPEYYFKYNLYMHWGFVLVVYLIALEKQGADFKEQKKEVGEVASRWKAIGIGLLFNVIFTACVVGTLFVPLFSEPITLHSELTSYQYKQGVKNNTIAALFGIMLWDPAIAGSLELAALNCRHGYACSQSEQHQIALEDYGKAIRLDPPEILTRLVRNMRADVYEKQGKIELAELDRAQADKVIKTTQFP